LATPAAPEAVVLAELLVLVDGLVGALLVGAGLVDAWVAEPEWAELEWAELEWAELEWAALEWAEVDRDTGGVLEAELADEAE
jgi:hypothetical protein